MADTVKRNCRKHPYVIGRISKSLQRHRYKAYVGTYKRMLNISTRQTYAQVLHKNICIQSKCCSIFLWSSRRLSPRLSVSLYYYYRTFPRKYLTIDLCPKPIPRGFQYTICQSQQAKFNASFRKHYLYFLAPFSLEKLYVARWIDYQMAC